MDNLIDNFESSDDNEPGETDTDLALNLTELNLASGYSSSRSGDWFLDSGASKHVTGLKDLLSDLEIGSRSKISTAGGESLHVEAKGKVEVPTSSGAIKFDNVLYVPGITKNLLSVGYIADGKERLKVLFDSDNFWILKNFPLPDPCDIVATGTRDRKNGLYKFRPPRPSINSVETSNSAKQLTVLWHNRLGHASLRVLLFMKTHSKALGLPALTTQPFFCVPCHTGKQCREPKPRQKSSQGTGNRISLPAAHENTSVGTRGEEQSRTSNPLEMVHTDMCGHLSTKSLSGTRYILTITDDFSRFTWLFFLKFKLETLSKFRQFKAMVELQGAHKLKIIRSDRGGEFTSDAFVTFCNEAGIVRQLT